MIEQLARYKEERMRREYDHLREELDLAAEREALEKAKEKRRVERMERQRKQLEEFHVKKN
jgi:hypothetical protein